MNKQLTIRTTAIAASAALMASVALSGSSLAAPGGVKGPPPPKPVACDLGSETHKCVNTLQSVNAAILGATTAPALAAARGWHDLVTPGVLVGVFGYALGTFTGTAIFHFWG